MRLVWLILGCMCLVSVLCFFFFSSRRRHTRSDRDWSSDVCSSDLVERLVRQVPGRLAVVAVVAGTVFSAISGSTIATTAMLGSLMLPVMLSRGYHPTMATGPLMAIGAVDMLMPPSALTVLLGSLSGISISKLLIGGVMPGLILSLAFVVYIVVRVKMNPSLAPAASFTEYRGWAEF